MPDVAQELAQRIGRGGASVGAQLRRIIQRMQSEHQLAKRVFMDGDNGLRPGASEWMRRLAHDNFVESRTFNGDRDQMLINEGRRVLALEILGSVHLDTERLGALTRMERETND